jgi:hypothetical protein
MKILKIVYETDYRSYEATFSNDPSITFVTSQIEIERRQVVAGIELALFKATDDSCGPLVKQSLVQFDNGFEYEYPLGQFNKEGKLPFDHQQFLDFLVGQDPMDTIVYAAGGPYTKKTNENLRRLSVGRMAAIRWDSSVGMVIEHGNGRMRSVFATSAGERSLINLSTRLTDIELKRHPFHIISSESIGLLDPDHAARFYEALLDARQPESQIIFLGRLLDVLGTPLTKAIPNIPVIDLENNGGFQIESEEN